MAATARPPSQAGLRFLPLTVLSFIGAALGFFLVMSRDFVQATSEGEPVPA